MLSDVPDSIVLASREGPVVKSGKSVLSFSGYIQPQFQAGQKNENSITGEFQGGVFDKDVDNRFRLRRGRIRFDYIFYDKQNLPSTYFVFQFDGTEQGVNIRDFWGRYYENKLNYFSFTAGMMPRPFGHELQLSSSARESPERGRMSQLLMKTERDLGVELTFHPRSVAHRLHLLQIELGVFNGQGLAGNKEFDSKKDFIGRISLKPRAIKTIKNLKISGGVSTLLGGIVNRTDQLYSLQKNEGSWVMASRHLNNNGKISKRRYYGADFEIETASINWRTELRLEHIFGTQTGTANSSVTPGVYPVLNDSPKPLYMRPFNGSYFNFIQNVLNENNQLLLKFDWYDPNIKIKSTKVDAGSGFSEGDIRFSTLGFGLLRRINKHFKIIAWYDRIWNENTRIVGFEKDVNDNVFTLRGQFSF